MIVSPLCLWQQYRFSPADVAVAMGGMLGMFLCVWLVTVWNTMQINVIFLWVPSSWTQTSVYRQNELISLNHGERCRLFFFFFLTNCHAYTDELMQANRKIRSRCHGDEMDQDLFWSFLMVSCKRLLQLPKRLKEMKIFSCEINKSYNLE